MGDPFYCVMTFSSTSDLGMAHTWGYTTAALLEARTCPLGRCCRRSRRTAPELVRSQRVVARVEGKNSCEPFAFRSPDGGEASRPDAGEYA